MLLLVLELLVPVCDMAVKLQAVLLVVEDVPGLLGD